VHAADMPELGKAAVALCLLHDFLVEKFTPRDRYLSLNTKDEHHDAHLHHVPNVTVRSSVSKIHMLIGSRNTISLLIQVAAQDKCRPFTALALVPS